MSTRDAKLKGLIRTLAADYLHRESNGQSLITVTDVEIRSRGSRAIIFVTVLPENMEKTALAFIHRQLTEFRQFVMDRARLMRVPLFDVAIDKGEKNRQRLDEVSKTM